MIRHTQARHSIFLCINNQFRRISIKTIRFKCIDINLGQRWRHFFLYQITESVLLRCSCGNITTIQLTGTVEIFIISLLFGKTEADVISIPLSLILNRKLNSKTFTGIYYLIIITINKTIHMDDQHSRFHRHRSRFLLLCHPFSLLQCLIIGQQTGWKRSIWSTVSNNFHQDFILRFHIHILIYTRQPLHIHFRWRLFFQNFQEQVFSIQQITGSTLTYQRIFGIISNSSTVIHNFSSYIEINTCQSGEQLKTIRMESIQTFVDVKRFLILSLAFQNTCLDGQYLIIIGINFKNTIDGRQ